MALRETVGRTEKLNTTTNKRSAEAAGRNFGMGGEFNACHPSPPFSTLITRWGASLFSFWRKIAEVNLGVCKDFDHISRLRFWAGILQFFSE